MTIMMRLTYVLSLSDGLRSQRWLLSSQSEAWIIHSDQLEALVPDIPGFLYLGALQGPGHYYT